MEIRNQRDIRPKNNPAGSDLNHPRFPLCITAGLKANSNAENMPAVFLPLSVLTKMNITVVVRDPIITGKIIVKSNKEIDLPKIEVQNGSNNVKSSL